MVIEGRVIRCLIRILFLHRYDRHKFEQRWACCSEPRWISFKSQCDIFDPFHKAISSQRSAALPLSDILQQFGNGWTGNEDCLRWQFQSGWSRSYRMGKSGNSGIQKSLILFSEICRTGLRGLGAPRPNSTTQVPGTPLVNPLRTHRGAPFPYLGVGGPQAMA